MKIDHTIAAVISGGASGLGAGVVTALAGRNARITILDTNADLGQALARDTGALFLQCDVTDPGAVSSALQKARVTHGQERLTINCAGIAPASKTVSRGEAHDADLFQRVIAINLVGSFNLSSQCAAGMSAASPLNEDGERGVIINTASVAAYDGQIGQIAYAASKGGIAAMTLPMARDLADKGVRVMAIAPGIFGTPMLRAFPQEVQDALAAQVPFPSRLGEASEFADLALHIAENPMLNGSVIRLDGAIRMPPR